MQAAMAAQNVFIWIFPYFYITWLVTITWIKGTKKEVNSRSPGCKAIVSFLQHHSSGEEFF
jgi:hypothetical protein